MAPQLQNPYSLTVVLFRSQALMKIFIVFLSIGAMWAQQQQTLNVPTNTPDVQGYEEHHFWSGFARKYLPATMPHPQFVNSNRLDSLMRAGNIYLSLQDAI